MTACTHAGPCRRLVAVGFRGPALTATRTNNGGHHALNQAIRGRQKSAPEVQQDIADATEPTAIRQDREGRNLRNVPSEADQDSGRLIARNRSEASADTVSDSEDRSSRSKPTRAGRMDAVDLVDGDGDGTTRARPEGTTTGRTPSVTGLVPVPPGKVTGGQGVNRSARGKAAPSGGPP